MARTETRSPTSAGGLREAHPYEPLRRAVQRVNAALGATDLVLLAFGNASAVDRAAGVMAIKPSGADYATLQPEDIIVLALATGEVVSGARRPSSDTATHLALHFERKHGPAAYYGQRPVPRER